MMAFGSRLLLALWMVCLAVLVISSWSLSAASAPAAFICMTSAGLVTVAALYLVMTKVRPEREARWCQELSTMEAGELVPSEAATPHGAAAGPHSPKTSLAHANSLRIASADKEVQCNFDDMLVPMRPSPLGQSMAVRRIMGTALRQEDALTVTTLLSRFDDMVCVTKWADTLDEADCRALADWFFGSRIAGKCVKRRSKCTVRRVPSRVVDMVAAISQRGQFRCALFRAVTTLFLGGIREEPFCGRSLAALAKERPERFSPLCAAACDFLASLVRQQILPRSLAVEVLRAAAEVPSVAEGSVLSNGEPPLVIYRLLLAIAVPRRSEERIPKTEETGSVPRLRRGCRHTVGTSLHWHVDLQPFSAVTVEGVEVIPAPLDIEHVEAYWRFVAGGEHTPMELEKRAKDAAAVLVALDGN